MVALLQAGAPLLARSLSTTPSPVGMSLLDAIFSPFEAIYQCATPRKPHADSNALHEMPTPAKKEEERPLLVDRKAKEDATKRRQQILKREEEKENRVGRKEEQSG